MDEEKFCRVIGCRFPYMHTTTGHKCGFKGCKEFGHGQYEHNHDDMKKLLKQFYNEILPQNLQCTIKNCAFSKYHTTESHQCRFCKRFGHGIDECIYQSLNNIENNLLNNISKHQIINFIEQNIEQNDKIYIRISSGYDDSLFIKKINNEFRTCFITDYYDQFTRNTEDYQLLLKFLEGFTDYTDEFFGNPNDIKECPICRTQNLIREVETLYCDAECSVCMNNKVELMFPKCRHACICKQCFEKL